MSQILSHSSILKWRVLVSRVLRKSFVVKQCTCGGTKRNDELTKENGNSIKIAHQVKRNANGSQMPILTNF